MLVIIKFFFTGLALFLVNKVFNSAPSSAWIYVLQIILTYWLVSSLLGFLIFTYKEKKISRSIKMYIYYFLRWKNYEYWSPYFFYFPIVGVFLYNILRCRSIGAVLYANPQVPFGGLANKTKSQMEDQIAYLSKEVILKSSVLKSGPASQRLKFLQKWLSETKNSYPLVFKPDQGQRGLGVKVIHDEDQAQEYIRKNNTDVYVQEYCSYENELGLFYIHEPNKQKGFIFSTTHKIFPSVVGNGICSTADLILADSRARYQSFIYREQLGDNWLSVPKDGERVQLTKYGNHSRGAIFEDGSSLLGKECIQSFIELFEKIPHFYIGRFDIRYENRESLLKNKNFKIIELNGAGSEATHIYDSKMSLFGAYKVLFLQWRYVFNIGNYNRKQSSNKKSIFVFLKYLLKSYLNAKKISQ